MSAPVPVAVLGCGHLGTYHARLYRELPGVELRGVMDIVPEKARDLGASLGVAGTDDLAAALRGVRAVSVATPTRTHSAVVRACLEAGCAVLVEKPIAADPAEGEEMVRRAEERGLLLAVGHVERWNPAFRAAVERAGRPRFIEAHRLATFVPRSLDVDVVLDLMIHDLDLVLALVDAELESVDAAGVPVLTGGEDIANARLRFADGTVANLTASRVSRERVRKIRIFAERRYFSIDLMEKRIEEVVLEDKAAGAPPDPALLALMGATSKEATPDPADDTQGEGSPSELLAFFEARRLRLRHDLRPFPEANALRDELLDFVAAVGGAPLRGASGKEGLRALRVAFEVRRRVRESLRRMGLSGEP